MNRKIFSRSLYFDTLRRTAVIGGLFTILFTVAGLLTFFAYISDIYLLNQQNINVILLNFYEMHPLLIAAPYTLTPLLCLNAFSFLNKRSTSDFWHSVPFKRICLYNTFSLAIFTWSVAAVIFSGAISILCFSFVPAYYAINWGSVVSTLLAVVAAQLLVIAGANIAMSITGTVFSNVVVSLLILLLPRVLLYFFANASTNSHLFILNTEDGFLSPGLNIVAGTILSLERADEIISSYRSIIYTAVLAVIYYFIGMVLFNNRKSEAAGNSAINKYMQAAFRIIVCLTVCLFPIYIITSELNRNNAYYGDDTLSIIVLYVVALAAYFIYELITTKKVKNLQKAIPALWIVVLLNVLIIGGARVAYIAEYNYTPSAADVSEIRLIGNTYNNSYFNAAVDNLRISDNEIEELLSEAYKETRAAHELGNLYNHSRQVVNVGFKTNGIYHYRHVYMDDKTYNKLSELLYNTRSFREEIYNVERIFENEMGGSLSIHLPFDYSKIKKIDREALVKAYISDVKKLEFNQWYAIANSQSYNHIGLYNEVTGKTDCGYIVGSLEGYLPVEKKNYNFSLPISNFTPTAYNIVMEAVIENQAAENKQQELIAILQNDDYGFEEVDGKYYHEIGLELYNGAKKASTEYYIIDNYEKLAKLVEVLEVSKGDVPDANSRIAVINYHAQKDNSKELYVSYNVLFRIPDDADMTFLLSDNFSNTTYPTDMEIR